MVLRLTLATFAVLVLVGAASAQAVAPWPTMRHDERNTGRSTAPAPVTSARPWQWPTGRGIFSTPVIDRQGRIFVGSADDSMYALGATGRPIWSRRTGEIIDAAGAIAGEDLVFGSGDEKLYRVRRSDGRVRWTFRATRPPATTQLVSWWEGNVALGPGGDLFAGNTGGGAYRISPRGRQRWVHQRGNSVWTTPAFDAQGNSYWGSLDLNVFSLDPQGNKRWEFFTPGFVVSSPALRADDNTILVASFDEKLYALDAATGAKRWEFKTDDHVYASPALFADGGVAIASTDGSVYRLTRDGQLRWRYDTGDAIRSSPVIGPTPGGSGGEVVYLGGGDGRLYALDAETGKRRWSFDTTPRSNSELADRDDLNGSPALHPRGVVIGGEHGLVTFVPYDWCRRAQGRGDPRCETSPGEPLGDGTSARVLRVTPGGTTITKGTGPAVPAAASIPLRLDARVDGRPLDAPMVDPKVSAGFAFDTELSGDGRVLFVQPKGFLRPGATYRIRVRGAYTPAKPGPCPADGPCPALPARPFDDTVTVRVQRANPSSLPVRPFRLRRLAFPQPSFVTSVNQIGFDSYELLVVPLAGQDGRWLWFVAGARPDRPQRVDPRRTFAFALEGPVRRDAFIATNRGLDLTFQFGDVPTQRFELRGRLRPDGRVSEGASVFGTATCGEVPNYAGALRLIGLCNARDQLPFGGTFLTRELEDRAELTDAQGSRAKLALHRPTATSDGAVTLDGVPAGKVGAIVLADAGTLRPLALDLARLTRQRGGRATLRVPAGTRLPRRVEAYGLAGLGRIANREFGS